MATLCGDVCRNHQARPAGQVSIASIASIASSVWWLMEALVAMADGDAGGTIGVSVTRRLQPLRPLRAFDGLVTSPSSAVYEIRII
jgi:hypothetical protein